MNFWKQIPTATKIYLAILSYLTVLLFILVIVRFSSIDGERLSLVEFIKSISRNEEGNKASISPSEAAEKSVSSDAAELQAVVNVQVFEGPGVDYAVIAYLEAGQTRRVLGISEDARWWLIELPYFADGKGWVSVENVQVLNPENIPVVTPERAALRATSTPERRARAVAIANVNIRSGPDLRFMKIGTLENGQTAEIIGVSPDRFWWLIRVPESETLMGWISRDYVIAQDADNVPVVSDQTNAESTIAPKMPYLVANWRINIRSGPDITFGVIGQLNQGQVTEIVGVNPDGLWWQIKIPGTPDAKGWVAAAYVDAFNTENVPVIK